MKKGWVLKKIFQGYVFYLLTGYPVCTENTKLEVNLCGSEKLNWLFWSSGKATKGTYSIILVTALSMLAADSFATKSKFLNGAWYENGNFMQWGLCILRGYFTLLKKLSSYQKCLFYSGKHKNNEQK